MASWSCRAKPKTRGGAGGWEITISDLQKLGPPVQHHRGCPAFLGQISAPNVACVVHSAFLAKFTAFSFFFSRSAASLGRLVAVVSRVVSAGGPASRASAAPLDSPWAFRLGHPCRPMCCMPGPALSVVSSWFADFRAQCRYYLYTLDAD